MRRKDFINALKETSVIMAIQSTEAMDRALLCHGKILFLVHGNIGSIDHEIEKAKRAGKILFLHLDMIEGMALSSATIDYLKAKHTGDFGIITTKNGVVKECYDEGIPVVKRVFALDSLSVDTIMEQREIIKRADAVEIMPGYVPDVVRRFKDMFPNKPVISGGLLAKESEVTELLEAGSSAISTTSEELWSMT